MTKLQRIQNILAALVMFAFAGLILRYQDYGVQIISVLVWISLTVEGIRELYYYFSMARHMVRGEAVLYRALLVCDLAIFTGVVATIPSAYILIYLTGLFGFAGVVGVLRAMEARKNGAESWRFNAFQGFFNIALAVLCLIFIRVGYPAGLLYSIMLINSAILRLISSFRRTSVIYIA